MDGTEGVLDDVGKWMAELEERLETIRTQVTDNGLLARAQSKRYFDAKTRTREFPPGSMVLLRTPGLTGKMKESWTEPFEVLRRVTAVNVELGLPGRSKKKCRVVHVNTIKPYHQPDCRVLRVMVVAEDPDELPLKPILAGDQLMEAQTTQLQQILEGAEGTYRDEPGLTTGCEHHIKGGTIPKTNEIVKNICSCHNFFPLSSVQIIFIPACCLLCVL